MSCRVIHPFGKYFNYWIAPIVVVFTQFDKLLDRKEMDLTSTDVSNKSDEEIKALVLQQANDDFNRSCVDQLDTLGRNLPYEKVSGLVMFLTRVRFH